MGDEFFDAFEGGIEADWTHITKTKVAELYKRLNDQDADKVFEALKAVIDANNKRRSVIKATMLILQESLKLGLKIAKA